MSFERFGSSDVYIYEHVGGFIECCGCSLVELSEDEVFGSVQLKTPRAALSHLDDHESEGDDIGGARRRIEKEYENLDAPIEPYVQTEEEVERRRERLISLFKSAKPFPPRKFRDASNGE